MEISTICDWVRIPLTNSCIYAEDIQSELSNKQNFCICIKIIGLCNKFFILYIYLTQSLRDE